jgi:hypothetical protein
MLFDGQVASLVTSGTIKWTFNSISLERKLAYFYKSYIRFETYNLFSPEF